MAVLDDVKKFLRVIGTADDDLITRLIESAAMEYARFTNTTVGSSTMDVELEQDAYTGVMFMVQAFYEGQPEKVPVMRKAAETLWQPYRADMGI